MLFKLIALCLSFGLSSNVMAESNSEKFKSLNVDSPERQQLVRAQNARVNARLKSSPNLKAIEKHFKVLATEYIMDAVTAFNGSTYTLHDRGLGKAHELVETKEDGTSKVLFSTLTLSRNNLYNIVTFKLNPSQTRAVLLISYKGSTDDYKMITLNLKSGETEFVSGDSHYRGENLFFKDDETLIIERNDKTIKGLATISILNNSKPQLFLPNTEMWNLDADWIHASIMEDDELKEREQFILTRDQVYSLGLHYDLQVLKNEGKKFWFKKTHYSPEKNSLPTSVDYVTYDLNEKTWKTLLSFKDVPSDQTFLEGLTLIERKLDFKKTLSAYNNEGKLISTLVVPFCCRVAGLELKDQGLAVTLSSPMNRGEFTWDLTVENPIIPAEVITSIMVNPKFELVLEERFAKSFDGTMIPYRLVYKKGTELKNAPVYMEVYGGFNAPGYFENNLNAYNREFIARGGVYVGPAVRGGNENGSAWHQAAWKQHKKKTYEDMAATAKDLIESGITEASRIAIGGSSNGGLSVAAAALLHPQYFGLSFPHNGVLDMLGKEELDERFNFGWKHEYGDSRIEADRKYIETYSPVELVTQVKNTPRIVVLNGRTDTRVNMAHSTKFAAAAESVGNTNVELYSITNSGHFNASMSVADYIGWRLMTVKWTTIYDFFGMKF